ncbi:hypothetical protein B0J12DRAFT_402923 [Macrophomina phaseolina]|uniref:Secreted protein n=1 Tax=Macrophomina phaseolina TaxID=35725 RepID=A0ABQ8GIF8_9PEZI|nr:hypothetical protein B0J12DRAFT_402923 [Macrophomina phaseolina]
MRFVLLLTLLTKQGARALISHDAVGRSRSFVLLARNKSTVRDAHQGHRQHRLTIAWPAGRRSFRFLSFLSGGADEFVPQGCEMRTAREWCDRSRPCHPIRSPPPGLAQSSSRRPPHQLMCPKIIRHAQSGWRLSRTGRLGIVCASKALVQRYPRVCSGFTQRGPRASQRLFPAFPGLCSFVFSLLMVLSRNARAPLLVSGGKDWAP